MSDPLAPPVANPQIQTQPAPIPPPDAPFMAAPPPAQPVDPIIPNNAEPAPPAFDEPSLRAREIEVERREDALNQRIARRREIVTSDLTDKEVESQIVSEYSVRAWDAFRDHPNITVEAERALRSTTICVLVLRNGFPIVGTSVAAAPENYDHGDGMKWAKADAMAKLWVCEEYALRNRIMGLEVPPDEIEPADPVIGDPLAPRSIQ